ncbi:MAG TPA: protein kinase [Streptosporangiaceae bacterium]|nr:protein kinase [Streptosporangiaceae bacterium]
MASTIPPQPDTVGFTAGYRISGYRLEQQIGRGGMAAVFGAYDERLERQVALKILAPALAEDEVFRQRFIAESRAAAAVEDPHIIPIYEAGEADGVLFIAMRLVRGGDLRTLVTQRGPLAPVRAEWILSAVASALDAAHASGLVHRDVKPANMLLDVRPGRPDHVYLSDFGVSKASMGSGALTSNGQFIGTVDYAAPEQILGQPVDGRTDQYALGCAAFELLCGRSPYSGKEWPAAMYSHLSAPPPVPTAERPELPAAVDAVFARVLAKAPADRYASCQEFTSALRAALGLKPHVADGGDASDQAPLELSGGRDATLAPIAVDQFPFRAAEPGPTSTDPSATSQLTFGGRAAPPAWRSRRMLISAAVAAVLFAGAVAGLLISWPHPPASAARYRIAAQSYPGGLTITQLWALTGSGGSSLDVRMTVSNTESKAVNAQLAEPIPAAVARDPGSVTFAGAVKPLATTPPVVVWDLRLPAHGHEVVSYRAPEPARGASEQRLITYVQAYVVVSPQQALELIAHLGLVSTVWISPQVLHLNVGQTSRLAAHGRLYNGRLAPEADLTGAVWTSANPAVLVVDRTGRVVGLSPGRALVWVQIGGVRAQATVVVNGAGGVVAPVYPGQPPVPSASPSASASGSPSPTGSPTASGSPSPTGSPTSSGSPSPGASPPAAPAAERSAGLQAREGDVGVVLGQR